MADITLDKEHTALLIADFYEAMMTSIPHAVERGVVDRTVALQGAARDAGIMVCYCATVFRPGYPRLAGATRPSASARRRGKRRCSTRWR